MKRSLGVADNVNDSIFPDILTKEKKKKRNCLVGDRNDWREKRKDMELVTANLGD